MNNTDQRKTNNCYTINFLIFSRQIVFMLFFLLSIQILAQHKTKSRSFGIHAGVNSGTLSGGTGPSFSFHYAIQTDEALQLESMLFFDSHSGKTFLSGHFQKNFGFGLAAGPRINFLPQKNWNPSIVIMPGIIYSSETTSEYDDFTLRAISGALCLAFSNNFYRRHMVSLGFNRGEYIFAAYIKYGFWF